MDRHLKNAALLYAAGLVLHTADHVRRGVGVLTPGVAGLGAASTIAGVIAIVLVLRGHPRAPLIAAVVGFQVTVGIAAVHLLPHWGPLSDALPGAHGTGVTTFSWIVVLVELVGAFLLGIAGTDALLHRKHVAEVDR